MSPLAAWAMKTERDKRLGRKCDRTHRHASIHSSDPEYLSLSLASLIAVSLLFLCSKTGECPLVCHTQLQPQQPNRGCNSRWQHHVDVTTHTNASCFDMKSWVWARRAEGWNTWRFFDTLLYHRHSRYATEGVDSVYLIPGIPLQVLAFFWVAARPARKKKKKKKWRCCRWGCLVWFYLFVRNESQARDFVAVYLSWKCEFVTKSRCDQNILVKSCRSCRDVSTLNLLSSDLHLCCCCLRPVDRMCLWKVSLMSVCHSVGWTRNASSTRFGELWEFC